MNLFQAWIRIKDIELDAQLSDKAAVLEALAKPLAERIGAPWPTVHEALLAREALGSTGLGRSFALPHARLPDLKAPMAAFKRLKPAIEFESADGKPVSFVLALLLPQNDPRQHLHFMAEIAGKFSDAKFCEQLAAAPTAGAAWKLLMNDMEPAA